MLTISKEIKAYLKVSEYRNKNESAQALNAVLQKLDKIDAETRTMSQSGLLQRKG